MKISEIHIDLVKPSGGLVGFASVVVDDNFYLGSIGIVQTLNGEYRLSYPTRIVGEEQFNIFYPINKEAGDEMSKAIINKLKEVVKYDDRYSSLIDTL
jgi:DNA-binding cell septation regulator SpoVG